jgi:hypothetical protein
MRYSDNPYVGSAMHNIDKQKELSGRKLRRAEARGYGQPKDGPPQRKRKKGKK